MKVPLNGWNKRGKGWRSKRWRCQCLHSVFPDRGSWTLCCMSDLFYSSLYYFSTCRQWCPPPKALSPSVEVFLPVFFLTNMRIECFSVAYQQGGTVVAGWLGFFFFSFLYPPWIFRIRLRISFVACGSFSNYYLIFLALYRKESGVLFLRVVDVTTRGNRVGVGVCACAHMHKSMCLHTARLQPRD